MNGSDEKNALYDFVVRAFVRVSYAADLTQAN